MPKREGTGSRQKNKRPRTLSRQDILKKLRDNEQTVEQLERSIESKNKEALHREHMLVLRVAAKDRQIQQLLPYLRELKQAQAPESQHLRACFTQPTLSNVYKALADEVVKAEERLKLAEGDLQAWQFVRESSSAKRLVARCRGLLEKNQELGKQLSKTDLHRLETDLAMQETYLKELEKSKKELQQFVIELDEELVALQSAILIQQQQKKTLLEGGATRQTPLSAEVDTATEQAPSSAMEVDTTTEQAASSVDTKTEQAASSAMEVDSSTATQEAPSDPVKEQSPQQPEVVELTVTSTEQPQNVPTDVTEEESEQAPEPQSEEAPVDEAPIDAVTD